MEDNTIDITHEEVDLLAEMQKATEYKPETPTLEIAAPTVDNSNDFDPPPPSDDTTANDATADDTNNINAEDLTDLIMDASDMLIEFAFPAMYRSTIGREDRRIMAEIRKVYKQAKETKSKVIEFNASQQETMEIYMDYEEYVEDLPLTTKERKNLREPLRKVLSSVNFKASPENTLMAVAAMVLLPRLLPIGLRKFSTEKTKK